MMYSVTMTLFQFPYRNYDLTKVSSDGTNLDEKLLDLSYQEVLEIEGQWQDVYNYNRAIMEDDRSHYDKFIAKMDAIKELLGPEYVMSRNFNDGNRYPEYPNTKGMFLEGTMNDWFHSSCSLTELWSYGKKIVENRKKAQ